MLAASSGNNLEVRPITDALYCVFPSSLSYSPLYVPNDNTKTVTLVSGYYYHTKNHSATIMHYLPEWSDGNKTISWYGSSAESQLNKGPATDGYVTYSYRYHYIAIG